MKTTYPIKTICQILDLTERRVRGFKDHGEYEVVKGFEAQKLGHTITAIFDPSANTETGFLSCFAEPQEAAEFLTYKRGR